MVELATLQQVEVEAAVYRCSREPVGETGEHEKVRIRWQPMEVTGEQAEKEASALPIVA